MRPPAQRSESFVRTSRRGSTRSTGLIVAIGVGLACAGLIGYVVLKGPRSGVLGGKLPIPAEDPTSSLTLPGTADGKRTSSEGGWGLRVELADRADASRRAALVTAKRVEPLEGKRFRVTEPAAWIFFADGRAMRVSASKGLFSMPARDQAPEQGVFEGNVKGQLFADGAAAASGDAENPAAAPTAKPIATADLGQKLEFDTTLGEVTIPGAVAIHAEELGWMFEGRAVHILLDQPKEGVKRLTVGESPKLRRIAIATATPDKPTDAAATKTDDKKAATPIETLYKADFSKGVTFTSTSQAVNSEQAQAFIRLLGNKLRPTAIAKITTKPAPGVPATTPAAPEPVTDSLDSFEISSTGPLDITAVATAPSELAKDDVYLALQGKNEKPVAFGDKKSGLSGQSPKVEFSATRGDIALSGGPVAIKSRQDGELRSSHLALNLPTGVGQVRGEGSVEENKLRPDAKPDDKKRSLAWKDQADFVIDRTRGIGGLKEALVAGSVTGFDGQSSFEGQLLRLTFAERSQPLHAELTGGALARDTKEGALSALAMTLDFEKLKDSAKVKTEPRQLTAQGFVEARRPDSLLSADTLDARIERPATGKLGPTLVVAKGTVNFSNTDSVTAQGEEFRVDVPAEQAVVLGSKDQPGIVSQGGSSLAGNIIKLDKPRERVEVPGPGHFETSGDEKTGVLAAEASWTELMTFESTTGILDAKSSTGNTRLRVLSDDRTIETVQSDAVRVQLTPIAPKSRSTEPSKDSPLGAPGERKVLQATALSADAKSPAKVESRQYDGPITLASVEGRRAERILHLEGGKIIADNTEGTLSVPGVGKALAFDRRPAASSPTPAGGNTAPFEANSSMRGTTLMEWSGSMNFSRATGLLALKDKARLTHERNDDGLLLDLEANEMQATISGISVTDATQADEPRAALKTAKADGAIFGRVKPRNGERQITADSLFYDATAGTMRLGADQNGPPHELTIFDAATSSTLRAAEVLWDLRIDRIEVVKPSPLTAPR